MDGLFFSFLSIPIIATLLSFLPFNHWTVRIFDFPRLQIAILNFLCLVIGWVVLPEPRWLLVILQLLNLTCMSYQI